MITINSVAVEAPHDIGAISTASKSFASTFGRAQ